MRRVGGKMMAEQKKNGAALSGGEKFLIFLYLYFVLFVFGGLELIARALFGQL